MPPQAPVPTDPIPTTSPPASHPLSHPALRPVHWQVAILTVTGYDAARVALRLAAAPPPTPHLSPASIRSYLHAVYQALGLSHPAHYALLPRKALARYLRLAACEDPHTYQTLLASIPPPPPSSLPPLVSRKHPAHYP